MRKPKYLVATAAAGLIAAVALTGIASADVTALNIVANVSPAKQDKKVRGGVSVFFSSEDTHSGTTVPPGGAGCAPPGLVTATCKYFPPSTKSVITFPRDFKFTPGKIPACNLASLAGKDAAGAKAACPKSVVGTGVTRVHTLTEPGTPSGNPGTLNGVVTAFNGVPSGGSPTLYLHVDIAGTTNKPILTGTIQGNVLTVTIPPVPGTVIEHFDTTIARKVSKKVKNKSTGKTTKTYYLAAKCSTGTWVTSETNTYQTGKTLTATTSQKCKKLK